MYFITRRLKPVKGFPLFLEAKFSIHHHTITLIMVRNAADDVVDGLVALKSGKALDASEVERGSIKFVLREQGDAFRNGIADSRQCVEARDEVGMSGEELFEMSTQ